MFCCDVCLFFHDIFFLSTCICVVAEPSRYVLHVVLGPAFLFPILLFVFVRYQ